jgi:hypothetical protein
MDGGEVREIEGVVFYPSCSDAVMADAIVEVYDNDTEVNDESIITTEQISEIKIRRRRAACLTGKSGRFCFSGLPSGKYLLIIGHRSDAQFSAMHVVVTLHPRLQSRPEKEL